MGWRDRRYNSGREDMNAYFSNPGMALQYAFPLYTSSRLRIRLTFWFLLFALFDAIDEMRSGMPAYILLDIGVMLAVCSKNRGARAHPLADFTSCAEGIGSKSGSTA